MCTLARRIPPKKRWAPEPIRFCGGIDRLDRPISPKNGWGTGVDGGGRGAGWNGFDGLCVVQA